MLLTALGAGDHDALPVGDERKRLPGAHPSGHHNLVHGVPKRRTTRLRGLPLRLGGDHDTDLHAGPHPGRARHHHLLVVHKHGELVARVDARRNSGHVGLGPAAVRRRDHNAISCSHTGWTAHHELVPSCEDWKLMTRAHSAGNLCVVAVRICKFTIIAVHTCGSQSRFRFNTVSGAFPQD